MLLRLNCGDAVNFGQRIWLRVVDHSGAISNSASTAGWLAATARGICPGLKPCANYAGLGSGQMPRKIGHQTLL